VQHILQAYVDHRGRWLSKFQRTLALRAHDPSIWEDGLLDLVSPADMQVRDDLKKTVESLPWGGRGEIELYWRVMYAAYAEFLALTDPGVLKGEGIRPVVDVIRMCPEASRQEVLQDIIAFAGNQMRLRSGLRQRPEPLVRFTEVTVEHCAALIVGYGFDGKVMIDRETAPALAKNVEWKQDVRSGRWGATVMPWQFVSAR
jgi:hypothetical protein